MQALIFTKDKQSDLGLQFRLHFLSCAKTEAHFSQTKTQSNLNKQKSTAAIVLQPTCCSIPVLKLLTCSGECQ